MVPEQSSNVSVIEPIGPAIEKVKTILFKPFELNKWFTIGFCAWLAHLGSGANFNFAYKKYQPGAQSGQFFQQTKNFVADNLPWVILICSIAVIIMIILWLLITWLSSRGRFMFLHCVATNKAEVKLPWAKFQQHANSLFLFRLLLCIIGLLIAAMFCLLGFFLVTTLRTNNSFNVASVIALVASVFVFIPIFIVFLLVNKFTTDFVVPIMLLRTTSCIAGWREFLQILRARKGAFALYILFQIVIGMAISTILMASMCITCCCAACILMIPYIGTVLMLPLLVFKRAYSLCYLRQFGSQLDLFKPQTTTT